MRKDIRIEQNATYSSSSPLEYANGDPISNVSGYTIESQMRHGYANSIAVDFSYVLEPGTVTISLTANQTSLLESGRYLYDVLLKDEAGTVRRILEGCVDVSPGVTK